jgi:hypothetical protein
MRSNVRLRSNVFPSDRPELQLQVRGRPALKIHLRWKAPGMGEAEAGAHLKLKPRQVAELAWEIPCSRCGAMPEGPVLHNGIEAVEFRCPLGKCEERKFSGTFVNLNLDFVNHALERFGGSVSDVVRRALADLPPEIGIGRHDAEHAARMRQFSVRLTRTQYYFYGRLGIPRLSRIVNACLCRLLGD